MNGKLSLVATPIGNLEDITLRALRTLKDADVIFAEDTRHTAHLLARHQLRKPLQSYHEHNEARQDRKITAHVIRGERVALVSDAGTPGISDPGFRVVRACLKEGLTVEVVPGPCALIAALTASGLPTHEFHFAGFPPSKPGACEHRLRELNGVPGTLVFYESPHRVVRTLGMIASIFPRREVVVAREITKKFEEFRKGFAAELAAHFQKNRPRGEFVLLVAGADQGAPGGVVPAALSGEAEAA